jgi:hypothetical protein
MDDDDDDNPPRGRQMRAELRRRPLKLGNLTTAHDYAAKMAEAALLTAQQARDLKAAEKRLQAARQLDAVLTGEAQKHGYDPAIVTAWFLVSRVARADRTKMRRCWPGSGFRPRDGVSLRRSERDARPGRTRVTPIRR